MLTNIFSKPTRKLLYKIYGVIGVALGSIPVYCGATDLPVPTWAVGALAVYTFIGAPLFGATAAANVDPKDQFIDGHAA